MKNIQKINNCNACLNCLLKCPSSAISINASQEQIVIDRFKCITCKVCMDVCPIHAIEFVESEISTNQFISFKCRINKKRMERFRSI